MGSHEASEAKHTVPFDPHLIWLCAEFEEHSSYSCPTPVCPLPLLVHADKAHTPDASIPIQRHARVLCIPIGCHAPSPQDKHNTRTNITRTVIFMLYCVKSYLAWNWKSFPSKVISVRLWRNDPSKHHLLGHDLFQSNPSNYSLA